MRKVDAIVIGASAGAVEALSVLLPALPKTFPIPIVIVVHIPPDRESLLVELFRNKCHVAVEEAGDKTPLRAGTVYFAPPDYHVLVEANGQLSLEADEPVMYSRPSIDVLFESAAEVYRERLVGVILTGANSDGAKGLQKVLELGGRGLIQQPEQASAQVMVLAAAAVCPNAEIQTLEQMATTLIELGSDA